MADNNQRRVLQFACIDEMLADAEQLAGLDHGGQLRSAGQWTLGQALHHLAAFADFAFDGLPIKVPVALRLLLRPMKRRALTTPMPAGVRIPGIPNGTLAIEPEQLDAALPKFKRSFERLRSEAPSLPHPIFGTMTHDEWISLNLRHGELHLSFFNGA